MTGALQAQCFQCLQAWLRTGQAQPIMLSGTPLLSIIFAALTRDELVDYAVDVLVALIHETQELDDNTAIIQEIVQKLAELRPHLREAISDGNDDRVLGYCRAYVEAGEWYAPLIVKHADFFGPLVEAVADCCTVDELEIVDITVNFWHRLAVAIRKEQRSMQGTDLDALLQVYQQLLTTIIRHLHYPEDSTALVGQARDDFRSFRHSIGDTLKGACSVLGATVGLQRAHDLIQTAVASPSPRWQDVEAPLFAMRSMGAEVDPRDDEIMPAIMDLVLSLPSHPKIRYAATLVVGRYSEWVSNHPEFLERIVGFVLAGFESGERDVVAAAASTLRYLAYDCRSHLVQHLSQLHGVVQTISPRLGLEDRRDLGTALACIITAMPPHDIAAALRLLCEPHIAVIQSVAGTAAGAADLNGAIEALDMLDNLLQTVGPVEHLPNECLATCDQVWQLIHQLLQKHGDNDTIAENSCRVLRRGLDFFGSSARAVAPAVLDGLSGVFEVFPKSGFLWITGKVSITFGHEPDVLPVVQRAIGRETARVVALLQATADTQHISDILEDYTRLIHATVRHLPPVILLSDTFAPAFQIVLAALASLSLTIRDGALDVVHMILDHECLSGAQQGYSVPPELQAQYASFAQAIQAVVGPQVAALSASLVPGMIAWDDEASDHALVIVRVLTRNFAEQFTAALPAALERVDARFVSADDKTRFLQRYQEYVHVSGTHCVARGLTVVSIAEASRTHKGQRCARPSRGSCAPHDGRLSAQG